MGACFFLSDVLPKSKIERCCVHCESRLYCRSFGCLLPAAEKPKNQPQTLETT